LAVKYKKNFVIVLLTVIVIIIYYYADRQQRKPPRTVHKNVFTLTPWIEYNIVILRQIRYFRDIDAAEIVGRAR